MSKKLGKAEGYSEQLRAAQIGLSALQRRVIGDGRKVLITVEGRDAAGKDGSIKRIVAHLSPRETHVVALGQPSDHDRKSWYFQRWSSHLPISGEIAVFNRSWYNRAGVERVMGYSSDSEYEEFMATVPLFEQLLAHCGVTILKYYLDISKSEQKSVSPPGAMTRSSNGNSAQSTDRRSNYGKRIAKRAMRCSRARTASLRLGRSSVPMTSIVRASRLSATS